MTDVLQRLTTALSDRYTIERELGAGGMATVYLATDLKHERHVAIKVLRPELAAVLGPKRFLREIKLAANLTHPHILPLHDSGDADGFLYYVMPYVEGESLRDRLNHEKQLPVEDALQIAREVATALSYAHDHDVVHRDIKPENILLAAGTAVVADFGIAKAVTAAGGEKLTETGIAMGTPQYMSPEQAAGSSDLDGRSDIYALGCVLYEMLAGQPPFSGPTVESVVHQHLTVEPRPVVSLRPAVPALVTSTLERALQKTPADRFASAAGFVASLTTPAGGIAVAERRPAAGRRWAVAAGVAVALVVGAVGVSLFRGGGASGEIPLDPNAVAVLPFRVSAGDSTLDYLREGMVDLLHTKLTGEGGPRAVDPRAVLSAWRRAVSDEEHDLSPDESVRLARQLGAAQVLLGGIVGTPSGLTISASVLSVPSGNVVAERSVIGVQDSLSFMVDRLVAEVLSLGAGEGEQRLAALTSTSLPALRAYLAGQHAYRRGQYQMAIGLFDEALAFDSTFALAAIGLGNADWWSVNNQSGASRIAWELRDRLSSRDLAYLTAFQGVGPRYPEPSLQKAMLAAREAAVEAAPDRPEAWDLLGWSLLTFGAALGLADWEERATVALDRAVELDSAVVMSLTLRLQLALRKNDTTAVRTLAELYFAAATEDKSLDFYRWRVAMALGDREELARQQARFHEFSFPSVVHMANFAILDGVSLDNAAQAAQAVIRRAATPGDRMLPLATQAFIALARGRSRDAVVLLDSFGGIISSEFAARNIIEQGLIGEGYDSAATSKAAYLAETAPAHRDDPNYAAVWICYPELWRVTNGDTSTMRETVAQLRILSRERDTGKVARRRVGPPLLRPEGCPLLLEAMAEGMQSPTDSSPALEALATFTRRVNFSTPDNIANLVIARLWERQGKLDSALAAVRRRIYIPDTRPTLVLWAYLREEGRLAALVGDTTGAIRAYRHYLTLRTDPDPELVPEVERVRTHLAELLEEYGER